MNEKYPEWLNRMAKYPCPKCGESNWIVKYYTINPADSCVLMCGECEQEFDEDFVKSLLRKYKIVYDSMLKTQKHKETYILIQVNDDFIPDSAGYGYLYVVEKSENELELTDTLKRYFYSILRKHLHFTESEITTEDFKDSSDNIYISEDNRVAWIKLDSKAIHLQVIPIKGVKL